MPFRETAFVFDEGPGHGVLGGSARASLVAGPSLSTTWALAAPVGDSGREVPPTGQRRQEGEVLDKAERCRREQEVVSIRL